MTPAEAATADSSKAVLPAGAPQSLQDGFSLVWEKLDGWLNDFILIIPNLIGALLAILFFLALAWGFSFALRQAVTRSGRRDLARMLASFVFWFVVFIGFLVVITILLPSMRPVDIFTSLGIGSVALGFAFKDILQNWIAGFFILIRRPFHRGDQISVGDIEGTVQAVETRATLVKTYSGRLVIIPNGDIYTRAVTVHTAYENRRSELVVPVGIDVDLDRAIQIIREATLDVEHVLAEPPPDVLPWEFRNNNIDILVRWWSKSQRTYEVHTRAAVLLAIMRASEAAGIALPADNKISFAETPLLIERHQPKLDSSAPKAVPRSERIAPPDAEADLARIGDAACDPEAEMPKRGELNEGDVPR